MYTAFGIDLYSQQEFWYQYDIEWLLLIPGKSRCMFYELMFGTYHWLHQLFFDKEWKVWFKLNNETDNSDDYVRNN